LVRWILIGIAAAPLAGQRSVDPHVALRHSLAELSAFEWRTYLHTLAFAGGVAHVATTEFQPDAGVHVWLLAANDSGWSAVAISDIAVGDACGLYYGRTPPPLGRGEPGTLICLDAPPEPLAEPRRVFLAYELPDSELPHISHCDYETRADTVPSSVVVDVRGIVGADGQMQSGALLVRHSPTLAHLAAAIRQVSRCRFVPGRHDGVAVPVSVVVHWRVFGSAR
jgi:hypothetical protein